jgi:serine/threonine-protein kinase HipA
MARTLDVYLHDDLVGHLVQDDGGRMVFGYVESWLNKPGATPLSQSLPLRPKRFGRNECRGYFAGILPEASKREVIARNLGISARNDYAILKELPKRPLLAGDAGIRLSLAGAQDKIAVRMEHGEVYLPLGGAPSTHILKPAVDRFEGIVFNEAFCMKLAHAIGLQTAKAEVGKVEKIDYLLIERYDRTVFKDASGAEYLERQHQEDFCQALGVIPTTNTRTKADLR